jgi:hypothetical protein
MNDSVHRLGELDELEAPDLRSTIERRAAHLRWQHAAPNPALQPTTATKRGLLIASGTAAAILLVVVAAMLVARRGSHDLIDGPVAGSQSSAPRLVGDGGTVEVTVAGVAGHVGHELAGVLYAGGELLDLDADAVGGFWAVIDDDDFTATAAVRTPATNSRGRFPFVTDTALTIEPGTYTLVVWVDHSLGSSQRWVPINTDNRGLYGCHLTFDVGTDPHTVVTVPANLQPDGWNVDCITGATTPNTDAAAAVAP